MIEFLLKNKKITGENFKKAVLFYNIISEIYHSKSPREGATRKEIYKLLRKKHIYFSLEEVSRFLQYLKDNRIVTNVNNDYWVTIA